MKEICINGICDPKTSETTNELAIRAEHSGLIDKYKDQDLETIKQELEKLDILFRDLTNTLLPTGIARGRGRNKIGGQTTNHPPVVAGPVLVGSLNLDCAAYGVTVVEEYTYVASYYGLKIINTHDPTNPELINNIHTDNIGYDVEVIGNYAYVVDGSSRLVIIDISDKNNLFFAGIYDTGGYVIGVAVVGNYAYAADYDYGLEIIDISDKSNPSFAGSYDTNGYALGVTVAGDCVYVADGPAGLVIIDISNPKSPKFVGNYGKDIYGITVAGDYAYAWDHSSRLMIIDVSDKRNPSSVGSYDIDGHVYGVTVVGDYVYVANNFAIKIIKFLKPISKTGTEDTTINFSQNDFTSVFTDADGDSLTQIHITSLPENGILKFFKDGTTKPYIGVTASENNIILANELIGLIFEPAANWYGATSFSWKGYDGIGYSVNSADVTIEITSVNDLPMVSDFTMPEANEDTMVIFSESDFTRCFIDADGDSLTQIQITSLPNNGELKLSDRLVDINKEIVVNELNSLIFEPTANWNGNTSFNWKGYDGTEYSVNPADVNITIKSVNDLPVVGNILKTGTEDDVIIFTADDFTNDKVFSDIDGDSLTQIQITSLPNNGEPKLSDRLVDINKEIVVNELNSLIFEPNANWNGNTSFNWKGYDGTEYSVNPANVDITIKLHIPAQIDR